MIDFELKIEELLLYYGKITREQLDYALNKQKNKNIGISEILIEEGYITSEDISKILKKQLQISQVDLNTYDIDPQVVQIFPESVARRHMLIAIDKKKNSICVAMADPYNIFAMDDLKIYTNHNIQPVISDRESILKSIDKFYGIKSNDMYVYDFESSYDVDQDYDEKELVEVTNSPIVRLLNSIIQQAVEMRASDIHIEPLFEDIRIRFRIDGDLQEIMKLSKNIHSPLVTRVKIIGQMDIAEKRVPQDGRVELMVNNKEIDMRISTMPTIYGEKVSIRLLDRSNFLFSKSELGFNYENLERFNKLLVQPFGMILATGPTGSGKTTTLYAILNELNKISKNIITIEDPVEYKLDGINQMQINTKAGITFANGLKSILRQDPDIIMIGEIRDSETASIAIRAAITGHLVLSTLHTNDSASSIIRLIDMGVEPYLVSSAVIGVISQRLVKKLCPNCKAPYEADYSKKMILGVEPKEKVILYKPTGCNKCNNGYIGRTAVHELMIVDEGLRGLINRGNSTDELRKYSISRGMTTILDNSIDIILQGISSFEECLKASFTLG